MCLSVVGKCFALSSHGHRSRGDLDTAIHILDIQLGGHIHALSVLDHQGIAVCRHGSIRHIGCCIIGGCGLQRVALGQGAYTNRCAVGFAVIGEGAARGGYHDLVCAVGNLQLTGVCRSNYVELTGINRTHSALGEFDKILVRICLGSGCGDTLEGHTIGCSGIATDGLLCAVVGECVRVGLKGHILIIIECNHILARIRSDGNLLGTGTDGCIAVEILGGLNIRLGIEGSSIHSLGVQLSIAPHILDSIAQITSDRPAASESHIVGRHSELAVCHSGIIGSPPGEGISIQRGSSCNT